MSLTSLSLGSNFSISDVGALSGLTSLTELDLTSNSITDLGALSGLTSLTTLGLDGNSISDIGALSGLTSLTILLLASNSITDIGVLSGLTSLTILDLTNNLNLANLQPLLDNTGLGAGDLVSLLSTSVTCTDVSALQAKGMSVLSDC
jgi:internalin A